MARKKASLTALIRPPLESSGVIGHDLKTIDENGVVPRTRLKDAKAAHSLFITLLKADEKSQHNRIVLEEMVDGAPPQKDAFLAQIGMGFVYNLNFLESESRMAAALVSYDDLADSSEHLIVPEMKPNYLSPEDATEALDIVAEEHAKLVREKSGFYSNWQRLAKEFVGHGVGWLYFPDADTPWAKPAGWDNVLIPRKTETEEQQVLVFITRHPRRVSELYQMIEDPKYAVGWDAIEVKRAIVGASRGRRAIKRWTDHWAEIEKELKNNDLGFGLGDTEEVLTVDYWVQEFDGSYSLYVGLEDGTNVDFLYKDEKRYEKATQAFISFTLGVGKGTYHSIRGMLWKMFPFIQTSNRFQNKILTNADISMTMLLQGEEGDSYDDMQLTLGPAVGFLPAKAKVVDRHLQPDVGTQGMPIVEHLSRSVQNATGQFQAPVASVPVTDGKGNPPTKYQLQSEQQTQGSLTNNSVNRFYRSMDTYFQESFRRIQKIGPGGKALSGGKCRFPEVKEFFERCKERMKPLGIDAAEFIINGIRSVTAARSIGNGSPQMRLLALDELNQMAGALDETGRELAVRDRITLRFGRQMADRYKPRVKRIAPDVTIAVIENAALKSDDIPVLPDQNHNVHAQVHVPKFQQGVEQLVSTREQNPEADFRPLSPILDYLGRLYTHASQHVAGMASNPLNLADMKAYRAALEQGGNLMAGFARELQQQERHAQDQSANMTGGAPAGANTQEAISESDPRLTFEIQKQQAELQQKLQHNDETHQMAMQLASAKVAQIAQQMQLEKIKTDADIAAKIKQGGNKQISFGRDATGKIARASVR